jgi:hypothetical protein
MRRTLSLVFASSFAFACGGSGGDASSDGSAGSSVLSGTGGTAGKSGSGGASGGKAGGAAGNAGTSTGPGGNGGATGGAAGKGGGGAGTGGAGAGGSAAGAGGKGGQSGAAGASGKGGGGGATGGSAGTSGAGGSGGAPVEICNGKDDNGNGQIDEGCDDDMDGWCDASMMVAAGALCTKGSGDCDDTNPKIYPGSTNHIEGVDYDCDGKKEYLATLIVTVDDQATELCVNGVDLMLGPNYGNWTMTDSYQFVLESGPNAVGISGKDTGMVITAMAAYLTVAGQKFPTRGVPAGKIYMATDPEWNKTPWRYFPKAVNEDKTNWCSRTFNDATWGPAMAAAAPGSPSTLVGDATPWGCGQDLCTAFPPSPDRPDWIWDPFPVDLQSAWIRIKVDLP